MYFVSELRSQFYKPSFPCYFKSMGETIVKMVVKNGSYEVMSTVEL